MNRKLIFETFRINTILFWKYKVNVFFDFFSVIILPMILNYIFSQAIIRSQDIHLQYNLLTYIILSNFILAVVLSDLEFSIGSDIKNGKFMYKLLSPCRIPEQYLLEDITKKIIRTVTFVLPVLILTFFLKSQGIVNIENLSAIVVFLLIALALGFSLSFLIGILSFWLVEIWGINSIKNLAITIFTGAIIPLDIFPLSVQKMMVYLPFPYLSYFPTMAINGQIPDLKRTFIIGIVWIFVFSIINILVWTKGIKKYEGVNE